MKKYRIELVCPGTVLSSVIAKTVQTSNWKSAYAWAQRAAALAAELWNEDVKVLNVRRIR